jgi:circadian clock protein KaiB
MKRSTPANQFSSFERDIKRVSKRHYSLKLYVSGVTPRSLQAIEHVKQLCETHLKDRYDLTVVDMYQQPQLAKEEQILAAPTLIKLLPPPLRRFIGDMTKTDRLLEGLDLRVTQ